MKKKRIELRRILLIDTLIGVFLPIILVYILFSFTTATILGPTSISEARPIEASTFAYMISPAIIALAIAGIVSLLFLYLRNEQVQRSRSTAQKVTIITAIWLVVVALLPWIV